MTNILEVIVDVSSPGGQPGINVFYFDAAVSPATIRLRLQQMYSDLFTSLTGGSQYTIRNEGKVLNDEDGVLQSMWSDSTPYNGGSSDTSIPVANASQILLRWATESVVDGRLIRGRTYIPGCAGDNLLQGELIASYQTAVAGLADTFAKSDANPLVWHRPKRNPDTGVIVRNGQGVAMTGGSCWRELAVLRHRR